MATAFTIYKLIILYMLECVGKPMTNSQISDFILGRDYTNYFHLQQTLSELTEAGLVEKQTLGRSSFYNLTPDGQETFSCLERDLSSEIRREIRDYVEELGLAAPEKILTPADYYTASHGGYTVRCQLIEKNSSVIDLQLAVPTLEAAKEVCLRWPDKAQDIYNKLMEELL